jgi:hypothetical protein
MQNFPIHGSGYFIRFAATTICRCDSSLRILFVVFVGALGQTSVKTMLSGKCIPQGKNNLFFLFDMDQQFL